MMYLGHILIKDSSKNIWMLKYFDSLWFLFLVGFLHLNCIRLSSITILTPPPIIYGLINNIKIYVFLYQNVPFKIIIQTLFKLLNSQYSSFFYFKKKDNRIIIQYIALFVVNIITKYEGYSNATYEEANINSFILNRYF